MTAARASTRSTRGGARGIGANMGCRHSTPQTRGGAALRPKLVRVRAASRVVRDSASSLEAGQLSAGSPDSKRLEDADAPETVEPESLFAARSRDSEKKPSSAANARSARPTVRFTRGTPVVPVDDRADRAGAAFLTDAFGPSRSDDAEASRAADPATEKPAPGASDANDAFQRLLRHAREGKDDASRQTRASTSTDVSDDDDDRALEAETSSVLFMSAFDGAETRRSKEGFETSEESLDALLRETRALLRRTAPGRFGTGGSVSSRESTLAEHLDAGVLGLDATKTRGEQSELARGDAERVPVLEAFDEEHARRKKTRGGGFAGAVAPSNEALANRRLVLSRPSAAPAVTTHHQSDAARTARVAASRSEGHSAASPSATKKNVTLAAAAPRPGTVSAAAPFERTRRRFAERTARVSGSSVASSPPRRESRAALDGGTRRPPAAATRKKGSAARPARASLSHGRTVSASAGRARRLEDVLAAYRLRESSVPETFVAREACRRADLEKSDENVPFRHAMRDEDASSPSSSRAQSSERCSKARVVTDRVEGAASLRVRSVASPTVRATPLTSGAPKRTVAPMSDKMRRARGALRALQIPGAEPAAPRHARAAAKVERVSPAATFAMA